MPEPRTAGASQDPNAYVVRVATSFQELEQLAPELVAPAPQADLYSTWHWFNLLATHGTDKPAQLLLALIHDPACGQSHVLPLQRHAHAVSAAYGPVLRSLSNYYSSLYGPVGDPAQLTVGALRAALRHLRAQGLACQVMDFLPLDAEGPFFERLAQALRLEGYWVDAYRCFGNWHLAVNNRSYAEYETSIPSRLRNTIKRNRKRLDAAGPWTLEVLSEPGPQLERGVADWRTVYDKSWKVPEPYPSFVPGLIRLCSARGWLRLGVLRLGDLPIAAQLWIVKDDHALIYKLAYDEDYKRFSAGSVLSAELMRRALDEDRVLEVDYLTGDDSYKVDWMSDRRQRMGLVAFNGRSAQGLISFVKQRLGRAWRRWWGPAARAQSVSSFDSPPNASTSAPANDPRA
jgi:hypothetical protein